MYFETGQGSALSAGAHHGIDQQTCEARAYAVARAFAPLLVNTVVGFIGPEYLYDGKEIIRAGLEDHFCGKLMGVPLGVDVCYTNHAEADQDDMDTLLTLLAAAGVTYVMGVPGADDVMLNYQSTSFHDALYVRELFGLKRAPEFEAWLQRMRVTGEDARLRAARAVHPLIASAAKAELTCASPGRDPWAKLARWTPARIALGRTGASLPTREVLAFALAHARARDAVHAPFDPAALRVAVAGLGIETIEVTSDAIDRALYLRRPDCGRRLSRASRERAERPQARQLIWRWSSAMDLSAAAVHAHAVPLIGAFLPHAEASESVAGARRACARRPRGARRRDRRAAAGARGGRADRRAAGAVVAPTAWASISRSRRGTAAAMRSATASPTSAPRA